MSAGLAVSVSAAVANTNSWELTSPDKQCAIKVELATDGSLSYTVSRAGKEVLLPSPLGLHRDDQSFASGLRLESAGKVEERRETYELFAGIAPRMDHKVNRRSLAFLNSNYASMTLDLAAANDGVAFRYRFAERTESIRTIESELTGFRVPAEAKGWLQPYHAAGPYTPAYEDFFFQVSPGDKPPRSRDTPVGWCFPALFEIAAAKSWILITESGTDGSYAGCHLSPDSTGGLYRIAFPLPDEHTKGQGTNASAKPRFSLPWTLPWRVIVLGKSAADIATSTWVTDLAPASRIVDTSWVKPGRVSWGWWSFPDGPANAKLFNEFSDFAGRMGWEYTLFDAGWWTPGLSSISSYAISNSVTPLAWLHASDFYDAGKRERKLDEMAVAGIRGVKVDFWCSDRQESIAAMHDLFEAAAQRRMVVNLHGCTMPRGWHRTWPNFLTAEAVLGTESYFYESRYSEKAAELNTLLPFTRNVAGPMDVTPVACSPKKFVRTTTASHELAAALIATSGLIHYADDPAFFESLPAEAQQVFRDAPARWDETRCLIGEPGRVVVFARRSGDDWFIAGINGTSTDLAVKLNLKEFEPMSQRRLIREGKNSQMEVSVETISPHANWEHQMPPRGGFILRFQK